MTPSDWSGPIGDVWAAEWRRTDRSFAGLAPHLDAAIRSSGPAATILDIGCGAGATSIATADARPTARIVGIDLSPGLVAIARDRAAGRRNLVFAAADVVAAAADHRPDLYVSRHGVMFFDDPVAAFGRLREAAAPDARLVFSCFAERAANLWAVESAGAMGADGTARAATTPGPFAFADPARVAAILAGAGWHYAAPTRVDFAYRAGEGADPVADAVEYFMRIGPAASLLRDTPSQDRPARLANLKAVCARYRSGDVVEFPASAWIWSAHAPAA